MMNKNRNKSNKGKIILAGLIILVIASVLAGMNAAKNKKIVEIPTVNVQKGTVEDKITETGNIELLRTVEVKSKIAGTVKDILVKEGEVVVKGQVLCVIDPDPTQTLTLFQKRSSVAQAQINLDQKKKELDRRKELAKTSLISAKELEDADNDYKIAQNNFSLAKQELEIMEKEIDTTGSGAEERIVSSKVRAPYNGYITLRYIEEGAIVTSGISSVVAGTNVFQIGDPSTKIIKANISEVDIGKVKVGDKVRIKLDAYQDTSFTGKIRHISPVGILQSGRNVVAFKTEIEILDEDPRLKPGMSCDVDVIIAKVDSVLYLPVEAVYEKKPKDEDSKEIKKNYVYLKTSKENPKDKKQSIFGKKKDPLDDFTQKEVKLGIKAENRVQMISAGFDTSSVVAADAEKFFKDLEDRNKKIEAKASKKTKNKEKGKK
jgi:HlyD family secretion protein